MDRTKLGQLSERLSVDIKKAEAAAVSSKQAANEASHGMATSYSVAGDVEHAKNSALLSLQKLELLTKLKEEVDEALEAEAPVTATPVCYVELGFDDGRNSAFYFVKNPVYISGLNLISPDSLLGAAIIGKKAGDKFSYKVEERNLSGIVSLIS
jgi:hypothetical protein